MLSLSLLFATSTDKVLLAKGVAMSFLAGYIGITATWVLLGVASLVLLALVSYVAVISTMKLFSFAKSYFQNANNEEGFVMVNICDLVKAMIFSSGTAYSSYEDRNADDRSVDDFEDDKGQAVSSEALVPAVFVVQIEEESDNEPDSESDSESDNEPDSEPDDEQEENNSIRLGDVD